MTDVESLIKQFIAEHESGGDADPRTYLTKANATEREELAALIEGYLMRAPRRRWDPQAYARSGAPEIVDALSRSLQGSAGLWPSLLPRLRQQARLKRNELVSELAARLGAEPDRPKVERYYHQMEQGLLPSDGVSDRVLEALGQIVGQSKEALREAGRSFGEPTAGVVASPAAFARTPGAVVDRSAPLSEELPDETPEQWDEVDRLFRGG